MSDHKLTHDRSNRSTDCVHINNRVFVVWVLGVAKVLQWTVQHD